MSSLCVRRLAEDDLPTRVAWFNTPSVYGQMAVDVPLSLAATRAWFARAAVAPGRYDMTFIDADGAVVAMGGLTDLDRRHGRAELYVVADPAGTGRGVGTAAVRWLCDFGFGFHRLNRIYLYTMPHNEGARRLYERLGFVAEGVLRAHGLHQGSFVDRHVHGLLRDEWARLPWSDTSALRLEGLETGRPSTHETASETQL